MVAIAVVSVISASTTGAQTALEITLTREEIDSQAEAIRFIQESYASALSSAGYDPDNNIYKGLWDEIGNKAITKGADGTINIPDQPNTCQDIYENDDILEHAFVVNTRKLGDSNSITEELKEYVEKVIVAAKIGSDPNSIFQQTTTYPRLYYDDDQNLEFAEGIYMMAVKDPESTIIAKKKNGVIEVEKETAYYDLYIRSCWYAAGAETPNTISTIIRIYNPEALQS